MRPPESFIGQPIRSLQTMLRVLAEYDESYLPMIPDGIYGPETMAAVTHFQRKRSAGNRCDQSGYLGSDCCGVRTRSCKPGTLPAFGDRFESGPNDPGRGDESTFVYCTEYADGNGAVLRKHRHAQSLRQTGWPHCRRTVLFPASFRLAYERLLK